MFTFCYGTDFHGDTKKFTDILNFAIEHKIPLIHLGADLLPKGFNMFAEQKKFINVFLKQFYQKAKDSNIDIIGFFGNDDIYVIKKYFKKYATLLDETPCYKDGYEFKAYPYVLDYPFGLKTACKLDFDGWKCPEPYLSTPVDCNDTGFFPIKNIDGYFLKKGTIEDDLKGIKVNSNTIMAIHQPPAGVDLDVCYGNRRVGSKIIYDWIYREQPLIVLLGHCHESSIISGIWKAQIKDTLVVQPGQDENYTHIIYFEITNKINAYFLKL